MFMSKRKLKSGSPSKVSNNTFKGMDNMTIVNAAENIAETLVKTNDELTVLTTIHQIYDIILNNWNIKFTNVFFNKTLLSRFDRILKEENLDVWIQTLKLVTNILFHLEELDDLTLTLFVEDGILDTIFECLCIPLNIEDLNTEKCKIAIKCLSNLSWFSIDIIQKLVERQILPVLQTLWELESLHNDDDFTNVIILFIDIIARANYSVKLDDIVFFAPLVEEKAFKYIDPAYFINVFNLVANFAYTFNYTDFSVSIIDPLMNYLSQSDWADQNIPLKWLAIFAGLENNDYMKYMYKKNILLLLNDVIKKPEVQWKKYALMIIHNIWYLFNHGVNETLKCPKLIEKIMIETGNENTSVASEALSTLSLIAIKSTEKKELYDYLIKVGILEYAIEILHNGKKPTEVILQSLDLTNNMLNCDYNQTLSENMIALLFQECLGLDALENLSTHENSQISDFADRIIKRFYGYEDEDQLSTQDDSQGQEMCF